MSKTEPGQRSRTAPITASVERQIDENLKRLYRQQMDEDLPDKLRALVAQLRESVDRDGPGGEQT